MPLSCHGCGGPHLGTMCRFKDAVCYACRKRSHCQSMPGRDKRHKSQKAHCVKDSEISESSSEDEVYAMFAVRDLTTNPIYKEVHINRVPIKMERHRCLSLCNHSLHLSGDQREQLHGATTTHNSETEDLHCTSHKCLGSGACGGQVWSEKLSVICRGKGLISWVGTG